MRNTEPTKTDSTKKVDSDPSDDAQPKAQPTVDSKASQAKMNTQPQNERRDSTALIQNIHPNPKVGSKLKTVPLFGRLNTHERAKLAGALQEDRFAAKGVIYKAGEEASWFYIIQEGFVTVFTSEDTPLASLRPGDYFGEQEILSNSTRDNTVISDDCLVWKLSSQGFRALFREDRIRVNFLDRKRLAVTAGTEKLTDAADRAEIPKAQFTPQEKALTVAAVNRSLLFQNFDDEHKQSVVDIMHVRQVNKGDKLINEGEDGHEFYVIQDGHVDVFQIQEDGEHKKVDEKGTGESFGELALMYDAPRNATCIATIPTFVRVLERRHFNRIVRQVGEARFKQYADWLALVELLAPLNHSERLKLAEALQVVFAEAGLVLFQEGDPGNDMYLVVSGQVQFSCKDVNGEDQPVPGEKGMCTAGGYFGERALLNNNPRACTVTLTANSRFLRISRDIFESILGPLEGVFKANESAYNAADTEKKFVKSEIGLNDVTVIGTLGRGAYGFVQLVRDKNEQLYALKAVAKTKIVQTSQQGNIFTERDIMGQLNHPMIIKLYTTFQDKDMLYFLMEASLGGELFRILRKHKAFPVEQTKFYAASVILAFEYLHSKHLVYRDLKPENLLLDAEGYIKLTDFGFCKKVVNYTWTMCGTPEYMAPEIIQSKGHGKGVDWWCVGILIYEMLASHTPFMGKSSDMMEMYRRIIHRKMAFPNHFSDEAVDVIDGLLQVDPVKRLGCDRFGSEGVKQSLWFRGFDWNALQWRKLTAPMVIPQSQIQKLANFSTTVKPNPTAPYEDDGSDWSKDF